MLQSAAMSIEPAPTLPFDDPAPPMVTVDIPADATILERFQAFHEANPFVYSRLEQMTDELVAQGRTKIGIGMLFEVLRWQALRTSGEAYKLNNNFRAPYARMIMDRNPDWAGVFETRNAPASSDRYTLTGTFAGLKYKDVVIGEGATVKFYATSIGDVWRADGIGGAHLHQAEWESRGWTFTEEIPRG